MKAEDDFPTLFDSYFDEIKEKAESTCIISPGLCSRCIVALVL